MVNKVLNFHCIILARGGSKGIPGKNVLNFLGKPLLAWTIEQCRSAVDISSVWVSSDDEHILNIAKKYGVRGFPSYVGEVTNNGKAGEKIDVNTRSYDGLLSFLKENTK